MTDVDVTFSLTKGDLVKASRAIVRGKREMRAVYMFMGLCVVLILGRGLLARDGPRYSMTLLGLSGVAAVVLVVWLGPWFKVQQNMRNHTQAFSAQRWRLGPSGLRVESPTSASSLQWSAIVRATESHDFILLYVSDATAYPIPKRALSPEQLSELRNGLRQWLSDRAQL